MRENQGYFALVQYSEYPERAEFVNIGIVLFANVSPFVFAKFVERPSRIERVFAISLGVQFRDLKDSIKHRLLHEFSREWSQSRVDKFIDMRSGKVRLSPARSIFVQDPHSEVDRLFNELVGELPRAEHGKRAKTKLKHQLAVSGVENLLDKPEPISLPSGIEVKAHYGYQNGSYNLIKAVSLHGSPDSALDRASPHMIEGKLLFDHSGAADRKKLVVVGDPADQEADFVALVEEQMRKHDVGFYRLDQLDPLVADIRKSVGPT